MMIRVVRWYGYKKVWGCRVTGIGDYYEIMSCPNCGGFKSKSSHTYGSYKVYFNGDVLKLKCKACGHIQRFRIIRGGI